MKLKSISDVITNSSNEVYLLDLTEDDKLVEHLKEKGLWDNFTEYLCLDDVFKDIKLGEWEEGQFLSTEKAWDDCDYEKPPFGHNPYGDSYISLNVLSGIEGFDFMQLVEMYMPFRFNDKYPNVKDFEERYGEEATWNLFSPLYEWLVGKALYEFSDDHAQPDKVMEAIFDFTGKTSCIWGDKEDREYYRWFKAQNFKDGDRLELGYIIGRVEGNWLLDCENWGTKNREAELPINLWDYFKLEHNRNNFKKLNP